MTDQRTTKPSPRRWLLLIAKLIVAGVVLYAVGGTLRDALAKLRESPLQPDYLLAAICGVVYLLGYLPMAWYWRRVLVAWCQPAAWRLLLRGYYLGHLGKYVPGKAMVVVLRTSAMRSAGGQTGPIAVSVFVETLTFMSVGGVMAGVLLMSPVAWIESQAWLIALAFALSGASVLPTLPPVMNWLIEFYERRNPKPTASQTHRFTWKLFGAGWLAAAASWCGLAVSLWIAVRCLSPDFAVSPQNGLACLLAVTLPVVAGFLSLIPGGFMVRDGLMVALLEPVAGAEVALAVTVLVRLTWVASEALVCAMLAISTRRGGIGTTE